LKKTLEHLSNTRIRLILFTLAFLLTSLFDSGRKDSVNQIVFSFTDVLFSLGLIWLIVAIIKMMNIKFAKSELSEQAVNRWWWGLFLFFVLSFLVKEFIPEPVIEPAAQYTRVTLQKAAEQGDPKAQFDYGVANYEGKGVAQNYTEAFKWYQKAAKQGFMPAQVNLGVAYAKGEGVSQNPAEAAKWFQKAAEQGDAYAQSTLGAIYAHGQGVSVNYAEAVKWFQKAAEQGDLNAQYSLGVIYATGIGVSVNHAEAAKWLQKAAEQGDSNSKKILESLKLN